MPIDSDSVFKLKSQLERRQWSAFDADELDRLHHGRAAREHEQRRSLPCVANQVATAGERLRQRMSYIRHENFLALRDHSCAISPVFLDRNEQFLGRAREAIAEGHWAAALQLARRCIWLDADFEAVVSTDGDSQVCWEASQ